MVVLHAAALVLLAGLQLNVFLVQLLDMSLMPKELVYLDVETDLLLEMNSVIQEAHPRQDVFNAEFKVGMLVVDSLQSANPIPHQPLPQHLLTIQLFPQLSDKEVLP